MTGLLPRETGTDVVSDDSAVVGLSSTHTGIGTTRELVAVTNNFSQSVTIEVKLTGASADWGSLIVDGIDMGDSVGFSGLSSGTTKNVDISLVCDESLLDEEITYEVTVTGGDVSGTIEKREVPINQYCLTWYDATDWDAYAVEQGVVHADYGDRNASDIELGYNTSEDGLVAYWPFDEESGSTATDAVGSNDGTLQNDPSLGTTGILNSTAYSLDGSSEYVQVSDSSDVEMNSTDEVSVSMWVNKDSAQSGWIGLFQHSDQSYNLQLSEGTEPVFTIYDSTWNSANSDINLSTNEWYHLTGTFDGSTIRIYINGTLQGTGSASFIDDAGGQDVGIGENLEATGRHFDGQIDEVRLYDRALSDTEVARLANGSKPQNESAAWNGTITTDWESGETLDVGQLRLSDTVANVSTGTVNISVQSDTNDDGTPDETSDPVTINSSTGPYPIAGLTTDTDTFRLNIDLSTTSITASPCFSGTTLSAGNGISNQTRSGCGMTNATANDPPTAGFSSSSANWYNDSWNHRKKITLNKDKIEANETDFPVLVDESDEDLAAKAQADGDDILFTDSDGETQLDHELESYDGANGDLQAWVKVPQVNATDPETVIYLYYNNSDAANQENATSVWSNDYAMVHHLEESSGSADDSTSNANDGSVDGANQDITGNVDGSYDFDGTDDAVNVSHDSSIALTDNVTVSAWVKPTADAYMGAVGKLLYDNGSYRGYSLVRNKYDNDEFHFMVAGSGSTEFVSSDDAHPDTDTWYHVVGVRRDGTNYLYVDGVEQAETGSQSLEESGDTLTIGRQYADFTGRWWDGGLDEIRVVDAARSAEWIRTYYNNTADPSAFYTVGAEADSATAMDFDASESSDPDGSISTYKWDWDEDGTYETNSTAPTATHTFDPGTYNVTLEVIDDDSASDTTTNTITVVTDSPTAAFTTSTATWYNSSWDYRKRITIDQAKVAADHSNYPVLVNITDADLAGKAQSDGDDLVFTDADGETKLDHEIESYNGSTGDVEAWVKVPSLNGSGETTAMYLYYGNSQVGSQSDKSATWPSEFVMVHHLEEASGTALDSTENANNGTVNGPTQGVDGRIDGAYTYDGTDDLVNVSSTNRLSGGSNAVITASSWFKPASVGGDPGAGIVGKQEDSSTGDWGLTYREDCPSWGTCGGYPELNNFTDNGEYEGGSSTYTYNHGHDAASNQITLVLITWEGDGTQEVDSVTYGGQSLTQGEDATIESSGFYANAEIWYILDEDMPAAGTHTIQIDHPSATESGNRWRSFAYTIDGVNQTSPFDTSTTGSTSSNSLSTSLSASSNEDALVSVIADGDGMEYTWDQSETEQADVASNTFGAATAWKRTTSGSGTVSTGATANSTPNRHTLATVTLEPASPPPYIGYYSESGGGDYGLFYGGITTGAWHHAGFVLNQSNDSLYLYVDGEEVMQDESLSDVSANTSTAVEIGAITYGSEYFDGIIDEVQVADTTRSDDWLQTHYNNTKDAGAFHTVQAEETEGSRAISFDASNSSDPDGSIETYEWDWDADGAYENSTSDPLSSHAFESDGNYDVTLKVTDNQNAEATTTNTVTVGAVPNAEFSITESWDKRKAITIDADNVESDLSNFPVLIDINDSDLAATAQADGDDILFTNDADVKLSHEIESYDNTTGDLVAWVNVTDLSGSTNTTIYLYYGNAKADNQADPAGVWDSNHAAVWHLNESPDSNGTTQEITDSTEFDNHGNANGSMSASDQATGIVGGAISFDGADDNITAPGHVTESGTVTLAAWIQTNGTLTEDHEVVSIGDYVAIRGWSTAWQTIDEGNATGFYYNGSGWPNSDTERRLDDSSWKHVVYVVNSSGDVQETYVNGSRTNSTAFTADLQYDGSLGSDTLIGSHGDGGGRHWNGLLDEIRVSSTDRSAAWIGTAYSNQENPDGFYSVGSEADVGETGVFDASNSTDSNGKLTSYEWDWDDDGDYEVNTTATRVVHQFDGGSHDVTLRVTDDSGATNTSTQTFFAGNQDPQPAFSTSQWKDEKELTIKHTEVDGDLTDYPLLVDITDAELASGAQSDGDDIVFTDGASKLDHEIESYNSSNGDLTAWVRVPNVSSSENTSIYLHYNNSAVGNQENPAGVWDSNFKMVQHLEETSGQAVDSTTNDNNGTSVDVVDQDADGLIDSAYDFEADNANGVEVPHDSTLNLSDEVTLSAWIKPESIGNWNRILAKSHTANEDPWTMYGLLFDDSSNLRMEISECNTSGCQNGLNGGTTLGTGTWVYATATYNGSEMRLYHNGTLDGSSALSESIATNEVNVTIGKSGFDADYYDGIIDEARISDTARSPEWIQTVYNNTADPAGFLEVRGETNSSFVEFNASNSTDPDGTITRYEWDFQNDSSRDTLTTDPVTYHDYGSRGTYAANLTVVDDQESQNSTTQYIEIAGGTRSPTAAFTNTSMHRKPITIDHTQVDSDLSNFPVLINITDTDLRDHAQSDGSDIRFTKGTTKLDHEIEKYENDTGHLVAWVNVPAVSSSENTTIHMYYNSTTTSDQSNVDGVWESGYEGVWHLNESSGFAVDSAGFDDNGSVTAGVTQGDDALIAGGYDLGGHHDDERIDTDDIDIKSSLTVSAWVYVRNGTNESVIEKWNGADDQAVRMNLEDPATQVDVNYRAANNDGSRFDATQTDIVPQNRWVHLAITWDGATVRGYRNGSEVTSGSLDGSLKNTSSSFILGGSDHESRSLDGKLDEVRVETTKRSAAWLNTSYRNQRNPSAFYSVGGEQNDTDTITFNASDSSDPDGTITEYKWDFNGDGSFDETTSDPVVLHQYAVNGTYSVELKVTDNETGTDSTTNSVKVANPAPTAEFSSSAWNARMEFTIDASQVDGELSDFPVVVDITDSHLGSNADQGGDDIVFTESDGETSLDHEIESYNNSNGDLVAWVNIPSVSGSENTTFYMYYNNSAVANQENVTNVWETGYVAVHHLAETSGSTVVDSTEFDNNGTNNGATQGAVGKLGTAYDFENDNGEYVDVPTSTSLNVSYVHYSAWVKVESFVDNMGIMAKGSDSSRQYWMWHFNNTIHYEVDESSYKQDYPTLSTDTWYKLDIVYNGTETRSYLNGSLQATHTQSGSILTDDGAYYIGQLPGWQEWDGVIDEARVRNGSSGDVASDEWIGTAYNNQDDPGSFMAVSDTQNGSLVKFDAGASSDDGTVETYEWDFTDDGTFERSTSNATTRYNYTSPGTYDVTLRVTDDEGGTDTTTTTITIEEAS